MDNTYFLWQSFSSAGTFLDSIGSIDKSELASLEGTCDEALSRMMEIKAQILNAKEAVKNS